MTKIQSTRSANTAPGKRPTQLDRTLVAELDGVIEKARSDHRHGSDIDKDERCDMILRMLTTFEPQKREGPPKSIVLRKKFQHPEFHRIISRCCQLKGFNANFGAGYVWALFFHKQSYAHALLSQSQRDIGLAMYDLAGTLTSYGDYDQSIQLYQRVMDGFTSYVNSFTVYNCHRGVAKSLSLKGHYHEALELFMKSADFLQTIEAEKIEILKRSSRLNLDIAEVFVHLREYLKAREYYLQAIVQSNMIGDVNRAAVCYNNLGTVAYYQSKFDDAVQHFERSYELGVSLGNKTLIATSDGGRGSALTELGRFEEAKFCLERSLSLHELQHRQDDAVITRSCLGVLYSKSSKRKVDLEKGERYLLDCIRACEQRGVQANLYSMYEHLALIYRKQKRWFECAEALEKVRTHERKQLSEEAVIKANHLFYEKKLSEEALRRERQINAAHQSENLLKSELVHVQRDIELAISKVMSKNSLLSSILKDLDQIRRADVAKRAQAIEKLQESIRHELVSSADVRTMDRELRVNHEQVFTRLRTRCPDLSPMELKIAVLSSLNLSSAAISEVAFISKRTVEVHRRSIRKKLGLKTVESLQTALAQLTRPG